MYNDGVGSISDSVSAVDAAVNDDDVDGIAVGFDCVIGDCGCKGFVVFILRVYLSCFILFIIIKIKYKIFTHRWYSIRCSKWW